MRILYITTHLHPTDGYGRYSRDVAETVRVQGHEVVCVVETADPDTTVHQHKLLGSSVHYWVNIFFILRTVRQVQEVIAEYQPDVVHILAEPYAHLLPFLKVHSATIVLSVHGTYAYIPALMRGVRRIVGRILSHAAFRKVDHIVAISTFTKAHLLGHAPLLAEKVTIIGGGIRTDFSLEQKNITEARSVQNVLFVGAIKKRKGVLEAVQGFQHYREQHPEQHVHFNIVGHYDVAHTYYRELVSYINAYDLGECVTLYGAVAEEELVEHYQRADVFLMTSVVDGTGFEGFGLVYLEANIYGVPCIGSVESGATDAIGEGISGYCVDPHNPSAIADALERVLDKQMISREECVEWAKSHSIGATVDDLLELYDI